MNLYTEKDTLGEFCFCRTTYNKMETSLIEKKNSDNESHTEKYILVNFGKFFVNILLVLLALK